MIITALFLVSLATEPFARPASPDCHSRARGNRPWVENKDYPKEARRVGAQGDVGFELQVSAEGCPTACTVTQTSLSPILDQATCRLMMERARFSPAEDSEGHRIPATYRNVFHWSLDR